MSTAITTAGNISPEIIEKLVLRGDLSGLDQQQRVAYYNMVCQRVGVDPAMQPFKLLKLQGKETLYLDRSGAQQLNQLHKVSHQITSREVITGADVYQVTSRATLPDGRYTESIGAVAIANLKGEAYANAIMKAETKAKRRATLDLLGLGMLDETEVETIPNAQTAPVIEVPAQITAPAADTPKIRDDRYYKPTNDADLIAELINTAQTSAELRTFLSVNTAFFNTNDELKQSVINRGRILHLKETQSK